MNTFMNLVKRSLEVRGTRGRMEVSGGIGALLLPALDPLTGPWTPASSSSCPAGLTELLTQKLQQAQDPEAIAKV